MSKHNTEDQTLAFAGILQALQLVQQTAHGKPCDLAPMQTSLGSILVVDSDSVEAVYGGVEKLHMGLLLLKTQFISGRGKPDAELGRYLITLLHLERKLSQRANLLDCLRTGIERAQVQAKHFDVIHNNLVASLADLYKHLATTHHGQWSTGTTNRYHSCQPGTRPVTCCHALCCVVAPVRWHAIGTDFRAQENGQNGRNAA